MSNRAKEKGDRIEREIVHLHRDFGVPAERVPLSGAAGGSFTGDIVILDEFKAEVKARANGEGFKTLETWKGNNDILFLRRDRKKPIVVLDWAMYEALITAYRDLHMVCATVSDAVDEMVLDEAQKETDAA